MEVLTPKELKDKVLSLPYQPGVYLMKDKTGTIIYVGKAKKLKNRVSQYFQDSSAHNAKTRLMVSHIANFDYIVAGSEFEALVLECSLIKRHQPKYNILLKDDKGYPGGPARGLSHVFHGWTAGERRRTVFRTLWRQICHPAGAGYHSSDPQAPGLLQKISAGRGKRADLSQLSNRQL